MARANCPECGGTGWRTVVRADGEGRVAVRCECTETDRDSRLLVRARIPTRYAQCDFDNFDTDLYEHDGGAGAWNRSLAQAKLVVQSFVRDFPVATDAGLLLMGPCGAGKTHLAVAALKELALRGHIALFYDYRELLKEIQASYNPAIQTTEMDVLSPVLTAELLLLDDLGSSKPSAWALETVGHILNTRYNEKRLTLITTNYLDTDAAPADSRRLPSGQPLPRADESLADRVGQRIRSRLYEMCRTVEITAPDYRKEVRQAGRSRA
jgi:DNA replication protein DnaC